MKIIKFKGRDLPKLLYQYLIEENGFLRLTRKREKPRYTIGFVGFALTLFDLKKGTVQFLE